MSPSNRPLATAPSETGNVGRQYLLDVSRLIWRYWTRRLPTGIDRVCLAYLKQFEHRARAVIQKNGRYVVLSDHATDRLFDLLLDDRRPSRARLIKRLALAAFNLRKSAPQSGQIYLNVGHTGLNEPGLPAWIRRFRLRAVYLVHDLIPLTHPQYCRSGEAAKHACRMEAALTTGTGIIANSQATLDELENYANGRGLTLPRAIASWISGPPLRAASSASLPRSPYFIMLGTIEGRKNHKLILDIWVQQIASLGEDAPTLVVVGQRGWEANEAILILDRAETFQGRLLVFDRCGDAELTALLGGARALLMPSSAEGFGLPVIEALQLGVPVVASDLPVFREIAGTIPTYLDADDADGWRRTIENFVAEHPERTRQLKALQRYTAPTWRNHFDIVEPWLDTL